MLMFASGTPLVRSDDHIRSVGVVSWNFSQVFKYTVGDVILLIELIY